MLCTFSDHPLNALEYHSIPDPFVQCQLFYCTHMNIMKNTCDFPARRVSFTVYGCFIGDCYITKLSTHHKVMPSLY